MLISKYAEEDGLIAHETITIDGVTWALGKNPQEYDTRTLHDPWIAYPDQTYSDATGLIAISAPTLSELRKMVRGWDNSE